MASLSSNVSSTHTYRESTEVNFFLNESDELSVTIDTDRLHLRSVDASEEDYSSYAALFGDRGVMSKFAINEQPETPERVERRVDEWARMWQQNNPYSGLSVFKKDTDEFLGQVLIEDMDDPGELGLGYLFMKNHWNQGFGSEAVTAVVKEYVPATVQEGYTLAGQPLERIAAISRLDNPYSIRILEKLGMHKIKEEEKYGTLLYHYSVDLINLIQR